MPEAVAMLNVDATQVLMIQSPPVFGLNAEIKAVTLIEESCSAQCGITFKILAPSGISGKKPEFRTAEKVRHRCDAQGGCKLEQVRIQIVLLVIDVINARLKFNAEMFVKVINRAQAKARPGGRRLCVGPGVQILQDANHFRAQAFGDLVVVHFRCPDNIGMAVIVGGRRVAGGGERTVAPKPILQGQLILRLVVFCLMHNAAINTCLGGIMIRAG